MSLLVSGGSFENIPLTAFSVHSRTFGLKRRCMSFDGMAQNACQCHTIQPQRSVTVISLHRLGALRCTEAAKRGKGRSQNIQRFANYFPRGRPVGEHGSARENGLRSPVAWEHVANGQSRTFMYPVTQSLRSP